MPIAYHDWLYDIMACVCLFVCVFVLADVLC